MVRLKRLLEYFQKPTDDCINWCGVDRAMNCYLYTMENWENVTDQTVDSIGDDLCTVCIMVINNHDVIVGEREFLVS